MFYCQNCAFLVNSNQPVNKVVVGRRKIVYKNFLSKRNRGKWEKYIKESNGWEIEQEINVCPKCYIALTGKQPIQGRKPTSKYKKKPENKQTKRPEVRIVTSLPILKD